MAFWHSDSPLRAVEQWLRDGGAAPSPDGSQQWKCTLEGASEAAVTVRLDQGWLVFTTVLPQPPAPSTRLGAWPLLLRNGALPGPGRIAWPFGESAPHVRCDLLLGEDGPRAISDTCRSMTGTLEALRAGAAGSGPGSPGARPAENAVDAQRLCAEAGWPGIERAGGRVAVALEVPGLFHEAILAPTDAGGIRAHVELGAAPEHSDIGRDAAARFLLAVSAVVRLVRPSAVPVDSGFALRYEAAWAVAPSPAELASSLEALSVACRACAREVKALRDDSVAAAYVARHERTPPHPGPASTAPRGDACATGRHTTPATTSTRSNGGPPVVAQRRELQ